MGDDLTDMGISATGGSDGARAGCSRASPGAPACGKHGCHDRPEAEPRPCGVPRPPRGMLSRSRWPPARASSEIAWASVPGALLVGAQRWPAAGISWRRTRNGQNPRPHRPAGGRRPNPCRERWRHSSPRPPPPQRAGRLRLGLQQFHLHDQLPDPLHGDVQFRLHRIALAFLERGIDPGDRLLTPLSSRKISTPNCRDKSSTGSPRKSRRATSRLRVNPSTAGQVPAGLPAKPGPGENVDEPSSPSFTKASNSNFVLKIVGHVPVLLGHFD